MKHLRWLLLAAAAYYAIFVFRISYVVAGVRYFVLVDDAMILMDYGRTFVQTGFMQWYPGYTLGFGVSSLFYALLGSVAWLLVPDPSKSALAIQVFNGIIWLLTLTFAYKAAKFQTGHRAGLMAFALLALCWPLTNMAVQGWEWALVALGLTMAYYFYLTKNWAMFALSLLVCAAARFTPYNATPLTLKLGGYPWLLMLTRGAWREASDFLERGLPIFGLALLGCWWYKNWLPMLAFGVAVLFSICVGGDVWHDDSGGSRWVLATMPLLVVAAATALDRVVSAMEKT